MTLAQSNLGTMYAKGQGVPQNYAKSLKWFHLAAQQGSAKALFSLGVMNYNGQGVQKNYAEALRFFRLAAQHGDTQARIVLERLGEH